MMYRHWPKREPIKNSFPLPNELFALSLNSSEISIYAYLLRCENRETHQCYPSYKTIGKAVGLCENTVRKYVCSLEEHHLIRTGQTVITTKDDRGMNGCLRYTICPIQEALYYYHERQLMRAEEKASRRRMEKRLARLNKQQSANLEKEEVSA